MVTQFLQLLDRLFDAIGLSVPPIVEPEQLRSLPPETLGRSWMDALDQHHLTPFMTGPRRKQLHDGIHVLTGYGIDPLGEAEVQAFLLGAKFHVTHIVLSLGILRLVRRQYPHLSLGDLQHRLWQAYQRGHHSDFDPDTWKPETLWHLPLAQVQRMYGL